MSPSRVSVRSRRPASALSLSAHCPPPRPRSTFRSISVRRATPPAPQAGEIPLLNAPAAEAPRRRDGRVRNEHHYRALPQFPARSALHERPPTRCPRHHPRRLLLHRLRQRHLFVRHGVFILQVFLHARDRLPRRELHHPFCIVIRVVGCFLADHHRLLPPALDRKRTP